MTIKFIPKKPAPEPKGLRLVSLQPGHAYKILKSPRNIQWEGTIVLGTTSSAGEVLAVTLSNTGVDPGTVWRADNTDDLACLFSPVTVTLTETE